MVVIIILLICPIWLDNIKLKKNVIILTDVARNGIFSLKWRHYGPKGGILDY